MVPDPPMTSSHSRSTVRLTPKLDIKGENVIVLSVFDGIGTGILAIKELIGEPRLALSWEIDPAACKVVAHHLPFVRNRGDFLADSPADVAHLINRNDPHLMFDCVPGGASVPRFLIHQ